MLVGKNPSFQACLYSLCNPTHTSPVFLWRDLNSQGLWIMLAVDQGASVLSIYTPTPQVCPSQFLLPVLGLSLVLQHPGFSCSGNLVSVTSTLPLTPWWSLTNRYTTNLSYISYPPRDQPRAVFGILQMNPKEGFENEETEGKSTLLHETPYHDPYLFTYLQTDKSLGGIF